MLDTFGTTCNDWSPCCAANVTAAAFSTVMIETANPATNGSDPALITSNGWVNWSQRAVHAESYCKIRPMADANNATAGLRVWGWNESKLTTTGGQVIYVPTLLYAFSYTAGNLVSLRLSTPLYSADTIAQTYGATSGVRLESPTGESTPLADVTAGYALIDVLGSQYLFFDFAINSGTAAAMNGLYKPMSG